MRVTPLASPENNTNYVISHQNITNRVLAEQQVELLAMQDALTGLSNRRAFNQFFEHELSVCTRKQVPVSVALIDLDYFKQLNDTYGHAAGDECLSNIGTILNNYIRRGGDFAARLGGDEFIVVFIDTDEENAKTMLDKLLSNINNIKLKTAAEQTVAASIGAVTLTPTNQDNLESIVKQADVALYKSKMLGRNQITFAD